MLDETISMSRGRFLAIIGANVVFSAVAVIGGWKLWKIYTFKSDYKSRVNQVKWEVKVPKNKVGTVIGKNGSSLRSIEEATGARLSFKKGEENDEDSMGFENDESDVFRTLYIIGSSHSIKAAEIMVRKIVDGSPVFKEEIMVPRDYVGLIIGKRGDTIREMSRSSLAHIQVGSSGKDLESVQISGSPEAINLAKVMIAEKIQQKMSKEKFRTVSFVEKGQGDNLVQKSDSNEELS